MKSISFYKKVLLIVLVAVVFGIFYSYRIVSRNMDFDINYKAGCLVREGKIEYVLQDQFPHKFPPAIGMYFSLFCIANHNISRVIFFWVSLASIIASFLIGMKLTKNETILTGFIVPILLVLRSVLWEFDLGNSNHLILLSLMIALYLYFKEKYFCSSLFFVFSATMKLFPGFLILFFIIKKKYKYLLYSLINLFILIIVLPVVVYGYSNSLLRLTLWLKALFGNPIWTVYDHANQSLLGTIARLVKMFSSNINVVFGIYCAAFIVITVLYCWYIRKIEKEDIAIALGVALSVILSPLCWIQTFLVSIFMLQIISPYLFKNNKVTVLLILGWIFSQVPNPELMGNDLEDRLLYFSVMFIGWVLYTTALLQVEVARFIESEKLS